MVMMSMMFSHTFGHSPTSSPRFQISGKEASRWEEHGYKSSRILALYSTVTIITGTALRPAVIRPASPTNKHYHEEGIRGESTLKKIPIAGNNLFKPNVLVSVLLGYPSMPEASGCVVVHLTCVFLPTRICRQKRLTGPP